MSWVYRGRKVIVPHTADIPREYRPTKHFAHIVQRVLNGVEPWAKGDDPIETLHNLRESLIEIVVPTHGRRLRWGKHAGHHARQVQLSPFVEVPTSYTRSLTVELTGSPEKPMLVRAYPGEYIPPLPWQSSADRADGGWEACVDFWQTHAYVYRAPLVYLGSESTVPPVWFAVV